MKFEKLLGTDNPVLKSLRDRKFDTPTEIQEKTIPSILEGKDIIGGAATGSGKTLAFAVGLIKNVKKDYGIQGLVLTPTRELAEQITNEIIDFSKEKKLNIISIYGGVSMINQVKRLTMADIVVGTPGRILDHLNKNSIDLSKINTLVLDEADRMLDMGFIDDVNAIIAHCSKQRQTMLFSATISGDIAHLAKKYLNNPVEVSAVQHVDPKKLEQVYYDTDDSLKFSLLKHLLEHEDSKLVMVFCNTRKNVDFVANNLKFMGIESLPIHGGFTQEKRTRILESFNSKHIRVLVATDVAARGLDIKGVSHVYNYDIPKEAKEYIHRVGRTARAGKEGKVINIVTGRDYDSFSNIMRADFEIACMKTPYIERVRIRWMPEKRDERKSRHNRYEHNQNSRGGSSRSSEGYSRGGSSRSSEGYSRGGSSRSSEGYSRGGSSRSSFRSSSGEGRKNLRSSHRY